MDAASPSNHGLLFHLPAIVIDSAEEFEDLEYDDFLYEYEEEGGDRGGPSARMLCQKVVDSGNKEPRSNIGVNGSLKRS